MTAMTRRDVTYPATGARLSRLRPRACCLIAAFALVLIGGCAPADLTSVAHPDPAPSRTAGPLPPALTPPPPDSPSAAGPQDASTIWKPLEIVRVDADATTSPDPPSDYASAPEPPSHDDALPAQALVAVPDPTLRSAFGEAYLRSPAWRVVADRALERGMRVEWGELPAGVGGRSEPQVKGGRVTSVRVVVSERLRRERPEVLAATLAHEAYHAAVASPVRRDTDACFAEETAATEWGSVVFDALPKEPPAQMSLWWYGLVGQNARWREGRTAEFLRADEGYRAQCAAK